jgi:YfiR/HmsC-like
MRAEQSSGLRWRWVSRLALPVITFAALLLLDRPAEAQPNLEYEVKAAFLLNFAKFVEWPRTAFADATAPIAICILGKDPFGPVIDELVTGETVNGRKLIVRRIAARPVQQSCQIVFDEAPGKEAAKVLSMLGQGVLTVGEGDSFVHDGGMIGFMLDNRRVRFDINEGAAEAAALKISSKLLSVARDVEK